MAEPRSCYPRFLIVFVTYTQLDEWISAGLLAQRIMPHTSSTFAKEVSRKLSNLNRFGHLDRRLDRRLLRHEYRRLPGKAILMPPELRVRFGVLLLPDGGVDLSV